MKPATMRYFDSIHAQLEALALLKANHKEVEHESISLLEQAEPYFLDGDIQEWLRDSITSFPSDICIGDVLPPSKMGWILFERPISHPDATLDKEKIKEWWPERTVPLSDGTFLSEGESFPESEISLGWGALAWSTICMLHPTQYTHHCPYHDPNMTKKPSLSILEYKDGGLSIHCLDGCSDEDVKRSLKERGFEWKEANHDDTPPVVTLDYYHITAPIPPRMANWALGSTQSWPFDKSLYEIGADYGTGFGSMTPVNFLAFVISLFAFMNQPFSTVESRRLPRSIRRLLQRNTGIEDPQIRVITLRRAQHTNGQSKGGSKEWSSRWLVKGHWRSQYYPSKKKNIPLWIMPYVKGPQDKPLKGRNGISLFHVTR